MTRRRTRTWAPIVALVGSAALHLGPLGILELAPRLPVFSSPIPLELVPAHRPAPRPPATPQPPPASPAAPPPPPRAPSAKTHGPSLRKPKPSPPRPAAKAPPTTPQPPAPPATADLRPIAPGDARIVVILRTDRLRASPHRGNVEALLERLPDAQTLLGGTGLHAVADFDALFIATADPYDVTATFLAARHADSARLREALTHRTLPAGDPRVFRFVEPGLSILTRPDGAERIDAALGPRTVDATGDGGLPLGPDPAAAWFAELRRFDARADEPGAPALLVNIDDLHTLVRLGAGLPTPERLALAATADASPHVRLDLEFATENDAARFAAAWPEIRARFRAQAMLLGLGGMLDPLTVEAKGQRLTVSGALAESQTRLALSWAKMLLPPPPAETAAPLDGGAPPPTDAATPPRAMPPPPPSLRSSSGPRAATDAGALLDRDASAPSRSPAEPPTL